VQQAAAQLPRFHNCVLLDKVKAPAERLWHVGQAIEDGMEPNAFIMQIQARSAVLPSETQMSRRDRFQNDDVQAGVRRQDEFYLAAVDDLMRHPDDESHRTCSVQDNEPADCGICAERHVDAHGYLGIQAPRATAGATQRDASDDRGN
jgi:hypothetical protein